MPDSSSQIFGKGIFMLFVGGGVALTVVSIVLLLGLALVGGVTSGMDTTGDPVDIRDDPNPQVGSAVEFQNTDANREILQVYQVNDSTGQAVALTGASDSYIQSQETIELAADDTWSVSTWARVDSASADETMTALSANGRVVIQYDGADSLWRAWYYDEGSRNSYTANVTAANQPSSLTLVTVSGNATDMWIYANKTRGETVDITGSNIVDVDVSAGNWDGTIDETRTFDDTTTNAEQATAVDNPVAPRDDRNRTSRLMYDEGSGDTTAMYFTSARADLSNHTWVNGLPGQELTEGTDYEINIAQGTITALSGGAIDGAPAVWIDYQFQPLNRVGQIAALVAPAFDLMSVAVIIIPAVTVLATLLGGLVGGIRALGGADFDPFGRNNNGR